MVTTSLYPKAKATESGFGPPSGFSPFLARGGGGEKRGEGGESLPVLYSRGILFRRPEERTMLEIPPTLPSTHPTPLFWMPVVSGIFPPLFLGIGALVLIDNSTLRGNLPVSNFLAVYVGNLRSFRFFQLGLIFSARKTFLSKNYVEEKNVREKTVLAFLHLSLFSEFRRASDKSAFGCLGRPLCLSLGETRVSPHLLKKEKKP